jgi:hypothetical protein
MTTGRDENAARGEVSPGERERPESVARPVEAPTRAVAVAAAEGDREREHLRPVHAVEETPGNDRPVVPPAPDGATNHGPGNGGWADRDAQPTCTVAQLRRFIKSRPWVPMHELRRRFGINGVEDDVTPIRVRDERLYIGLPAPEARLMAELLGGGDVGYELSLDPDVPVVVGVYPMRPVPRS